MVAGLGSQLQIVRARERVGVRVQDVWSMVRLGGRCWGEREREREGPMRLQA